MLIHQEYKATQNSSPSALSVKLNKEKIRDNWKLLSTQFQLSKEANGKIPEVSEIQKSQKKRKNSDSS